jgi:hypothetical protein
MSAPLSRKKKNKIFVALFGQYGIFLLSATTTMQTPQINRGKFSNFYAKAGFFALTIPKGKAKSDNNILTFFVGDNAASSVIVSRKEMSYVVRKIKKEIDSARIKA